MDAVILYFSRKGENYVSGEIMDLPKGNTQAVAEALAELTGAPLFQMEPAEDYPADYSACINQAKAEQQRGARPALKALPELPATVYLGYPNWWGTLPMPVFTMMEGRNWSGKRVFPFCTHEGSGLGHSVEDIRRCCPGAVVKDALALHGTQIARGAPSQAAALRRQLINWLASHKNR